MLIYEKNNKLNINFENNIDGEPDLQLSKEDGKTSVTIDGQSGGLPPATSEDVGKSVIVGEDGSYELDEIPTELPAVTTSDNGKVLGVVNGQWAKAEAQSGGTERFVFSISDKMDDSDHTCTSTKNATEIKAAITAGNIIVAKINRFDGNNNKKYTLDGYIKLEKNGRLYAYVVDYESIDSTPYLVLLRYTITTSVTRTAYKVALSAY